MAIPAVNLSYIGQPASPAAGQVFASNDSGPLGKVIVGTGTATLDGALTAFTVNFIDGVQKLAQVPVIIQLQSAAAPVTINGVANQAIYSGVGAMSQIAVGTSVVIAGFVNGGNNGTFTVNAVTASSVTVTNASSVAETNYAATLSFSKGPSVLAVQVTRSGIATDTAAGSVQVTGPSALSSTGFTANLGSAGTNGNTLTVAAEVYLAS